MISSDHFKGMLYYVEEAGNAGDAKEFLHFLDHHITETEYREVMQTVANALCNEGM